MRRETAADRLMNETALYGGLPLRRADIYVLACEDLGDQSRKPFGADWFAFGQPAVEVPEGSRPLTLAEAREIFGRVES